MPDAAPAQRARWVLVALIAIPAIVLIGFAASSALRSETIVVDVAPGTAARIAAGERVELLPRTLEVSVGDRLEVHNRDTVAHQVGPYDVAAGQTLAQTFTTPGTLEGLCTLHESGQVTIVVR
jgi:plastocyanin